MFMVLSVMVVVVHTNMYPETTWKLQRIFRRASAPKVSTIEETGPITDSKKPMHQHTDECRVNIATRL